MRFIVILFFTLAAYSSAQAGLSGIYSLKALDSTTDCSLYLFEDGLFYMNIEETITSDIIESFVLSIGRFKVRNDTIFLIDEVHGFEMEMVILNHKEIMAIKSFYFLQNEIFYLYSQNEEPVSSMIIPNINIIILQTERKDYNLLHKDLFCFKFGNFVSNNGYNLQINPDKTYSLYFKEILISCGNWKRTHNELVFYDEILRQEFYVVIGDNLLISMLLPGDYKGIILTKQN
jgi:hypothetical protein